jgi:hypothetical protein
MFLAGFISTYRSARENERVIADNTSCDEKEGVQVQEKKSTRASTSFRHPESNGFERAGAVEGNGNVSLHSQLRVNKFMKALVYQRDEENQNIIRLNVLVAFDAEFYGTSMNCSRRKQ